MSKKAKRYTYEEYLRTFAPRRYRQWQNEQKHPIDYWRLVHTNGHHHAQPESEER